MRVDARRRQYGLRFNMTPLIDIVFLLIIFFLTTSHFVRSETLESVDLPLASQTDDEEEEAPRRLVVTLTRDLRMLVAGKSVEMEAIEFMIVEGRETAGSKFEVRIRSDRTVPYGVIEPIMLACARSGVSNVRFPVIPE